MSSSSGGLPASSHPATQVLHVGHRADPTTGSVAVPIHQTTSYQFRDTEHAANLFALSELGNIYSRIMNPTCDVLEQRVAALEGGAAALALASGQAASAFALQNLARAGDNVVSSTDLYGGTWNLFANTLQDQGLEIRFVDPADPEAFRRASDDRTRAYYAETLPNPKLNVFPIREVADLGVSWESRSSWTTPPARSSADRSSTGPRSWCILRPSTSVDTAIPSAAFWSTAATSTGPHIRNASRP